MNERAVKQEEFARRLLDRLIELDYQTVEAYYEMGSIISSLMHGRLYDVLGYPSMGYLIEEELTFTPSTGMKYGQMYQHFRRLKYTKAEAISLLKKFGLTHMVKVLPKMDQKIGERAVKARIEKLDDYQINFTLNGEQLKQANAALEKMGAKRQTHRWMNSSEAFMAMVEKVLTNGG